MNNRFEGKHEHSGRSSRTLLDSEKVIRGIGLKKEDIFLDAGCGEGYFSIAVSEMLGNNGRVYAIDIDNRSISLLEESIKKKNIGNIEVFTGDITKKLPIGNDSIDVCLMANVFHGLVINKEVESTLNEIFRVLKPDGTLAIVDFKKTDGPPGPPVSIRIAPEEVEEIISRYGFKKKKVIEAGKYHYTVIFVKKIK
ncbi:MAG: class I SAM-dependent methyltransferase [Spirochaetes bacterium]|nr:class I SAM-dependent methyltransferase [Spirochaetota bacterium]